MYYFINACLLRKLPPEFRLLKLVQLVTHVTLG